jgi:hypothetical protein
MIYLKIGFILGFIIFGISFLMGLHYSHISIEYNKEYKHYYRTIIIMRYLGLIFPILGIVVFFVGAF